jgi:hypothetical protein
MAHRKITDRDGREWDVWAVSPKAIDRRTRDESRVVERRGPNIGFVGRVSDRLRAGWLAFQTTHEKRRLSPIPPGWETLSDDELLQLLEQAPKAGKPARLIE